MATAKKLPSGNYRVRSYIGTQSGKKVYRSFTAPTKKEAELLAAQYVSQNASPDSGKSATVAECIQKYIDDKRNVLSPSTIRGYVKMQQRDYTDIDSIKLNRLSTSKLQEYINSLSARLGPKSVRNIWGLLSAALRYYDPHRDLQVTLPQKKLLDLYVPSDADIKKLIDSLDKNSNVYRAILLAAFGSLRRSEVCALTSNDVDGNVITISKAMVEDPNKKYVIKQPKSAAGYRRISMPDSVIAAFDGIQGRLVNMTPDSLTTAFRRAQIRAGLPHFRFHDLRHYQASILHALGVPDLYVRERGGWKTEQTLKRIYQHTMDAKTEQVNDQINRYFDNLISNKNNPTD